MANDTTEKYFNAPIQLYNGFMVNSDECLSKVLRYACFEYTLRHECSFKDAANYFSVQFGSNTDKQLKENEAGAKMIYNSLPSNSPKVGIGLKIYWQYRSEEKTDFEKVCLLAYLALKSILQKKPYCKIDNCYLLSRMDGMAKSVDDVLMLSPEIKKYGNEYQLVKIKNELRNSWGLVTYARYTRGFYVSFSMKLEDLIFEAEKRRKSYQEKQYKESQKSALEKVLERLNGNTTNTRQ